MSYHTSITVTSRLFKGSSDALSPASPARSDAFIEEQRTICLKTDKPASQLSGDDIARAFKSSLESEQDLCLSSQEGRHETPLVPPSPVHRRSHQVMSTVLRSRPQNHRHLNTTKSGANTTLSKAPSRTKILFYHKHNPHYGFTNFSPHPVLFNNKIFPTSEHLFQSFKFEHKPDLVEHIRTFSERPNDVFVEARRLQNEIRPDWLDVNIGKMKLVLKLKFTQHNDLKEELMQTGDAELIEYSDKDSFWGIGHDQRGRNELGKALEWLREQFRDGQV